MSKSKDKIQPSRSRIPSSVQGCKKEIHDVSTMLVEDYVLKCKKMKKLGLNLSKPDTGKVIKGKRV